MSKKKRPAQEKFPELRVIRSLWREAMLGDETAAAQLLLTMGRYGTVDSFVRQFTHMKMNSNREGTTIIPKPRNPATAWEKGRENFQSGRTTIVGGGLPSLGKHSK